ncbi:unnamed protein product [Caenorhabditis bovis]|uniref:Glycosyltransferase family 92 protein n=1 Tax=Caenorhabditis bovis TaxID=2654633 RepID=A0A8S1EG11_9PELO|nr:unnamed protein product [Caenorhabditis bovis]
MIFKKITIELDASISALICRGDEAGRGRVGINVPPYDSIIRGRMLHQPFLTFLLIGIAHASTNVVITYPENLLEKATEPKDVSHDKHSHLLLEEIEFDNLTTTTPSLLDEIILIDEANYKEEVSVNLTSCAIESWNQVHTDEIPNDDLHRHWVLKKAGRQNYLYATSPSLLAAFAFEKHIAVTLTAETYYGKTIYCRYYDCRRREIPNQFKTFVFPEATVYCGRRVGARYISVTETLEEKPEYSVPIVNRVNPVPKHYFTTCMATLYGDEPKFLQVADFIEYYKIQGATFSHVYLRNVSDYDRLILDDYVRTGDIELIKMHDHFWRDDFMWHHVQITDCHQRNINFAKWTAFIDIDERIEMKSPQLPYIVDLLDTVTDPNIANLHFRIQWVQKLYDTPARYINDSQLIDEMIFRKYTNTSRVGGYWKQPKCIVRPEMIGSMSIHAPHVAYRGIKRTLVNETVGIVRHYRNVKQRVFKGALKRMLDEGPFTETHIEPNLEKLLTEKILERVKWVYEIVDVTCEQKQMIYQKHAGLNATCWLEEMAKNESMAHNFIS